MKRCRSGLMVRVELTPHYQLGFDRYAAMNLNLARRNNP